MANPTLSFKSVLTTPRAVSFPVKETELGDGYEQVGGVGIKNAIRSYNVTSGYLPQLDAMSLVNQFAAWRGIQSFWWTPDEEIEAPRLFVCQKWQSKLVDDLTRQLSATFEEVSS